MGGDDACAYQLFAPGKSKLGFGSWEGPAFVGISFGSGSGSDCCGGGTEEGTGLGVGVALNSPSSFGFESLLSYIEEPATVSSRSCESTVDCILVCCVFCEEKKREGKLDNSAQRLSHLVKLEELVPLPNPQHKETPHRLP